MKPQPPATTCTRYHTLTSYDRQRMSGHYLDWENQPDVYKTYPDLMHIPLSQDIPLPKAALSSVIHAAPPEARASVKVSLKDLSLIFLLTYSITARTRHGLHDFFYRNAASAGALYPTELYAAAQGVTGLEDGLYHFSIADHGLSLLRKGSFFEQPSEHSSDSPAPFPIVMFFLTAIFFRSSWKYRDRAYRYHLLDTGHVLENLTLALKNLPLPYRCSFDFDDARLNRFLGLDSAMEACLAICSVPGDCAESLEKIPISDLSEEMAKRSRVAEKEVRYAPVVEMHQAGAKIAAAGLPACNTPRAQIAAPMEHCREIPENEEWREQYDYGESILRRRSRRNFIRKEIDAEKLMALVGALCSGLSKRSEDVDGDRSCIRTAFICENVGGTAAGIYLIDSEKRCFGMIRKGYFLGAMAEVCLNQEWLANAAVHFLFLADLEALDEALGARGYRYAMARAGRMGQRLYLTATALGLGCCGIGAFYDQEAATLIGLEKAVRLLYLVGVGPIKA